MPKLSIITPIYNTDKYLDKCLSSLIAQTLNDIEFIWIDNAANEKCKEIIAKYQNSRPNIKVIHLEENVGYSGAMNLGLDNASGQFIGFCDSDDWVDSDYYENLYSKATNDTDIVYCEYIIEYFNNSKPINFNNVAFNHTGRELLKIIPTGTIWNAIFNKKLIDNNNIRFSSSRNSAYKDCYVAMQVIWAASKAKLAPNVYYHYFQRQNSTMHSIPNSKNSEFVYELLQEIFSTISFENAKPEEIKDLISFLHRILPLTLLKTFPPQASVLTQSDYFWQEYNRSKAFNYPSFWQRIYSISYHISKPIMKIRFLGLSVKLKIKKG